MHVRHRLAAKQVGLGANEAAVEHRLVIVAPPLRFGCQRLGGRPVAHDCNQSVELHLGDDGEARIIDRSPRDGPALVGVGFAGGSHAASCICAAVSTLIRLSSQSDASCAWRAAVKIARLSFRRASSQFAR